MRFINIIVLRCKECNVEFFYKIPTYLEIIFCPECDNYEEVDLENENFK